MTEILKINKIITATWIAFWRSRSSPNKLSFPSQNLLFLIRIRKLKEINTLMKINRKNRMKIRPNFNKFLLIRLFKLQLLFTKTIKVSWEALSRDPEGSNVPYKPQTSNPKILITFSKVFFKTKTTKKIRVKMRPKMIAGFSWFNMNSKGNFRSKRY